mmetsp:Transcript_16390/g.28112  ORF Transcript_16390/g.28112 Transcript_16390/m.28112 type:complete len:615 (+) Transcript_16390:116-1960(+)|eukprot:CAMPEP_0119108436 /NCGR_PEP_ID=MMETSP1180-20130426/14404_1 /TAXON_ID=3052 ORGANISM="Chlamydomonas cf sp, Strain CCMP681" /NCGR_SAMPLE_ID=MMETSP1180 /ASSEMBLY_ACC=CAM_ASM_000741 /LENGTH=614 /DNA_ID=CAMNT_0007094047 /DNA_START=116 /DNA_END=1960 /DNA_ORIENTATION=-
MSSLPAYQGPIGLTDLGEWGEYTWLVVLGAIVAFAMAWGIGANDVANAFGTAVGAKTITLWQACLIAAVFEFTGAIALGGQVTETVAGGITRPSYFADVPQVFAFGMLCALIAAWLWITLATYLELAVSTSHSIIGAILGFGLVYGGRDAVVWVTYTSAFPYMTGLVPVVMSWVISPVLAGVIASTFFLLNRTLVLRRTNAHTVAFWILPGLVVFTMFINVFFVLLKGPDSKLGAWTAARCAWVAACAAAGSGLITIPIMFFIRYRQRKQELKCQASLQQLPDIARTSKDWDPSVVQPTHWWQCLRARLLFSLTVDVHQDIHKDEFVANMHSAAEVFDPRVEEVYKCLQVFSSCCVSFAHGANDVANSVGPFSAIWYVYHNRKVTSLAPTPIWILAMGGAGIVLGLATYGYNIIKVLGVKMAKITPCRGYCAELATALTVVLASVCGFPISTTHCIVGAEVGVGMVEGIRTGTNWKLVLKTICAWLFTIAVTGLVSAGLFAFGTNVPSLPQTRTLGDYRQMMVTNAYQQLLILNATNHGNNATLGRFDVELDVQLSIMQGNLAVLSVSGVDTHVDLLSSTIVHTNLLYTSLTLPVVGFHGAASNDSRALTVPFR